MAASASSQPYESPDEVGMRNSREAREARKAARAAKTRQQNSGPYNNSHSPQRDDYRGYPDGEEPYSPTSVDGLQDAILAQGGHLPPPQQHRGADGRRGGDPSHLPPGYPGPAYEDGPQPGPTKNGHHQGSTLPSSRRQSANPSSSGRGPYGHSRAGSSSAEQLGGRRGGGGQDPQLRGPPSLDNTASSTIKGSPSRLESPSVLKSVLQPLEKKVNEYDRLMSDARTEMAQLDDELRALQERRQQAEDRFLSAKAKHDDYSRQHEDVGRAMRGDLNQATLSAPILEPQQPIAHAPIQRRVSFEERPPSAHSDRSYKPRARDRLRISLFKH